jgi:hypothetical protein
LTKLTRIIGALAIVAASFGVTLKLLDYWGSQSDTTVSPSTAGTPAQTTPPKPTQTTPPKNVAFAFSINGQPPNWNPETADTTTEIAKDGLIISSRAAANANELGTNDIATAPNEKYVINYDIAVTQGSVALGVLDTTFGKWISVKPISPQPDSLHFTATSNHVQIILVNAGPPPTTAKVARLILARE